MAKIISERMCNQDWGGFVECEPAVLLCDCGNQLDLKHPLDNCCFICGRNYNMSGELVLYSRDELVDEPY